MSIKTGIDRKRGSIDKYKRDLQKRAAKRDAQHCARCAQGFAAAEVC